LAFLADCHSAAAAANVSILEEAAVVLNALRAADVPTIVLKGGALITDIYDDPAARPLSDVDVLVPWNRVADARDVLLDVGFAPQSPITTAALRLTHAVSWAKPGRSPIDLHWHVFEECCRPDDDEEFWAAAVPTHIGGAPTLMLPREDLLMHVC